MAMRRSGAYKTFGMLLGTVWASWVPLGGLWEGFGKEQKHEEVARRSQEEHQGPLETCMVSFGPLW